MSAPIDFSRPHPRPRPFHNAAECGVCRGLSAPPIEDQAAHQAEVQRLADAKLAAYQQAEHEHAEHQAEEARRDAVQAVVGYRPKSWEEVRAEVPPALRLLLGPNLEGDPADLAAVKARAPPPTPQTLPDRRAAAAALPNRRARMLLAIQSLDGDAIDALRELREQLDAIDAEARAAGAEPEAGDALAAALDPSPAPVAAGPTPTTPPPPPKQPRDAVGRLLFGGE